MKKSEAVIGTYNNRPVVTLTWIDDAGQYPFSFGINKAKLILENVDAIRKLVASEDKQSVEFKLSKLKPNVKKKSVELKLVSVKDSYFKYTDHYFNETGIGYGAMLDKKTKKYYAILADGEECWKTKVGFKSKHDCLIAAENHIRNALGQ